SPERRVIARDRQESSSLDLALHYGRKQMLTLLKQAGVKSARGKGPLRALREVEDRVNMYNNRGQRILP
ncbi:MAG: hypothetical protein P8104_08120, partial [Gammaproteobacteria bacterium]